MSDRGATSSWLASENLLLARLPSSLRLELHARCEAVSLLRGQTLHRVGEPARHAYFLTSGLVSLLALSPDGATLELASVGHEGMVGVPLLLRTSTIPYQAVVQIGGAALRLRADLLTTALHTHPDLRDACLRYVHRAFTDVAQSTVCHHFHPLAERLCRWLLTASDRIHDDTLAVTHDALAQVLGSQRTAVTMAATELQKAEAIRGQRGRITIVNRRRLEVSACACYAATRELFVLTPPPSDRR